MKTYTTLEGSTYELDALPKADRALFDAMKALSDANVDWIDFGNRWMQDVRRLHRRIARTALVKRPIYKILQDLEARLSIKQGATREEDYRDMLCDLISLHYPSRYQFCKETGLDQGFLSAVLKGKKDLSLSKLEEILKKTNYRLAFVQRRAS